MITEVSKNKIWKFSFDGWGSNCYLIRVYDSTLKKDVFVMIDSSSSENKDKLIYSFNELKISLENVQAVFLTHYHPDHVGNLDLFENAEVFISKEEIKHFGLDIKKFKDIEKIIERFSGFEIIKTPGHTIGSVCFLFFDESIKKMVLFSGDTLFFNDNCGRTDFPSGNEKEMIISLNKLKKIKYDVLCPGHDY